MKPTLLVLAAGMGSRYGGLKQLDPVGPSGETIIDYSVHDAIAAGFGKIVFVIRPDFAELFKAQVGSQYAGRIPVAYAYQELNKIPAAFHLPEGRTKPWGTGHAVLMAADLIREPFAMINADDFYGRASFESMARFLGRAEDGAKAGYAMVGYALRATLSENGTVSRGLCELDRKGELLRVVEHTRISKTASGALDEPSGKTLAGNEIVSMNFFGFTPSIFGHLKSGFESFLGAEGNELRSEFYVPGVVDGLIQSGKASVKVLGGSDHWFGVTYPEDKPLVVAGIQALVAKGLYPSRLL